MTTSCAPCLSAVTAVLTSRVGKAVSAMKSYTHDGVRHGQVNLSKRKSLDEADRVCSRAFQCSDTHTISTCPRALCEKVATLGQGGHAAAFSWSLACVLCIAAIRPVRALCSAWLYLLCSGTTPLILYADHTVPSHVPDTQYRYSIRGQRVQDLLTDNRSQTGSLAVRLSCKESHRNVSLPQKQLALHDRYRLRPA